MLLKDGYLIDPASNTDELMDIRVENGTIVELGKDLSAKDEEEILDLSGLTVAPGLIDTHIHFRDPGLTYKEDRFSRCSEGRFYFCYLYGKYQACR